MTILALSRVARRVLSSGAIALFAASLTLPACVKQLPPANTPEAIAPPVASTAPPVSGRGRLVVDVVEGPTTVHQVRMQSQPVDAGNGRVSFRFVEAPEVLCSASPCVADIPFGNVLLGFPVVGDRDALEIELVHVGPEPSVYRRSLSVYHDDSGAVRVLGIIGTALGGTALATGAALLPVGLAKDYDGLTTAGAISLGAGAAVLTLGILAIRGDSPTYRAGASNHYPLGR